MIALPGPRGANTLPEVRFDETVPGASGQVPVTFTFYEQKQGGAPLWSETQTIQLNEQGRYSVLLGTTDATGLPQDLPTAISRLARSVAPLSISNSIVVCVLPSDGGKSVLARKSYRAFRNDLTRMRGWLKQLHVTEIAMESTGVYWWPVWSVLAGQGFRLLLVNLQQPRNKNNDAVRISRTV